MRYYLGKIEESPRFANYPEVDLYQQDPSDEFLISLFGLEKGRKLFEAYQRFFAKIMDVSELFRLEV